MGEDHAPHYYGGQALIEGVMMRGRDQWAVAVRRPTNEIFVETHPVRSFAQRHPIWRKPIFRGVAALGESLSIGMRAIMISANQALEDDEKLTPRQVAVTMGIALTFAIGLFIVLPAVGVSFFDDRFGSSFTYNLFEGVVRVGIFLAYLCLISFMREARRMFMYHGAEHKTIAAYEAEEPSLTREAVDRYSTLHVRCGTNFLIITMLLTIFVFTFFGRPVVWLRIVERIGGLFVIAGIAYEGLRLGARYTQNPLVRALMKPGLWLQKITTKPPTPDQIEVAIRSFEAVLPHAERVKVAPLPSPIVGAEPTGEA